MPVRTPCPAPAGQPLPRPTLAALLAAVRGAAGSSAHAWSPGTRFRSGDDDAVGGEGETVGADAREVEDEALRRACREAALEELLTRLHEPLLRFAERRLRGQRDAADLAADIAQETLIRLARGASGCRARSDAQVLAWALTTAHHVLIDAWRTPAWRMSGRHAGATRRGPASEAQWMALAESFEESSGRLDERSPAYELLLRLTVEACDAARDGIAALYWMRLVGGAEWAQVAETFGTTESGIKRRFQRAQLAMRRDVLGRVEALRAVERAEVQAYLADRGVLGAP